MRYLKSDKLYCFSPPVMMATFIIEVVCALYVVYRYKLTPVSRLSVAIMLCLAVFQIAEYNVCEGAWGVDSLTWARIGYASITLLPPLGLHLATILAKRSMPKLVILAYVSGLVFAAIFLFVGQGMRSHECLGNYVIFDIAPWAVVPYVLYYYGWLFITVTFTVRIARRVKLAAQKKALYALSVGYLAFILPAIAATVIDPSVRAGIPSIMCGFAVILAIIITGFVVPSVAKRK